jgi:hypothetical protein
MTAAPQRSQWPGRYFQLVAFGSSVLFWKSLIQGGVAGRI